MEKVVLLFCLFASAISAQTQHNEFNQALNAAGNQALRNVDLLVTCQSVRSGSWIANDGEVSPPTNWTTTCRKGGYIFWTPIDISGSMAVSYRVLYSDSAGSLITLSTDTPDIYLPIADPSGVLIEGYDELGNSLFTSEFSIAD